MDRIEEEEEDRQGKCESVHVFLKGSCLAVDSRFRSQRFRSFPVLESLRSFKESTTVVVVVESRTFLHSDEIRSLVTNTATVVTAVEADVRVDLFKEFSFFS